MKGLAMLFAGAALIACCQGEVFAQQDRRPETQERAAKQPYELTRAMEAVQDRVAMGDAEAMRTLPKMIGEIADSLLAADPAVWREPRNARAAVVYTLSGGQPRVIRKILELGACAQSEAAMMAGALAYVEGRKAKAMEILMPVDARTAGPALSAYIALIQSALIAKEDPGRAMRLLDEARILAPGALIEEAALRRMALLADETSNLGRFINASSQYIRRFQRSVYADNFRGRFAEAVTRFGLSIDPAQRSVLTDLLDELDSPQQLSVYLAIAQAGILKGKIEPASFAAGQAVRLSRETGLEAERARLYEATALILTQSPQAGLSELLEIDGSHLPKRDAALKAIIAGMATQIQNAEDARASDHGAAQGDEPAASGANTENASQSALMDAAQLALGQTDMLLKRVEP